MIVILQYCSVDTTGGKGQSVRLVDGRTDDVGPSCSVVEHPGDLLHRVVGPTKDEAAQAGNARRRQPRGSREVCGLPHDALHGFISSTMVFRRLLPDF